MASLSTEQLVGQLFLARCPQTNAAADIRSYHLGGYILFARDFQGQTPDSLRQKLRQYQAASAVPLLIAVDEEGGSVTRISRFPAFRAAPFPAPRALYAQGGPDSICQTEREKARLLQGLGVNVNMAPVCDITTDSAAFMYARSLGQSAAVTAAYVRAVVNVYAQQHTGCVCKHFPGYGNNADTHTGIAVDERDIRQLQAVDLVPFQAGIDAGCGAILVSHTIIKSIDAEYPATLSPAVHRLLRQEMGFGGVIVTDDLAMSAITDAYGAGEAAVLAVLAGNDLLCSTDYAVQYTAVLQAVKSGRIPIDTVRQAVLRLLRWKQQLKLL